MATDLNRDRPFLIVLGIAQDGGFPQAGCDEACCAAAWEECSRRRHPSCVAIVDPQSGQRWMLDCTPAFPEQLRDLDTVAPGGDLTGVLLTHAHSGHYTGLFHLGREIRNTHRVPVHAMPRMAAFLRQNSPWKLLVEQGNIEIRPLDEGRTLRLNERISVMPFMVPHRNELSETVGFRIDGPARSVLYLTDIDGWEKWNCPPKEMLASIDVAYLDGTFYSDDELPDRNMAEIPHPSIVESIRRFASLSASERKKVRFTHLNHTNPALDPHSEAARSIAQAGHTVARQGEQLEL